MSEVTITLDAAVVRRAIEAKVEPAVTAVLAKYDLERLIADALTKKPPKNHLDFLSVYYGGEPRPQIEELISGVISEAAKKFVANHLKGQRTRLEGAFKEMIAGSTNKLAATFLRAFDKAIGDEWEFEMKTTVAPKEPERDYD